jgi:transcriptional regulator with XRE-family HTH domain
MLLEKITPVDFHIAKKLREFRIVAGISQNKLAELTGLSFQQIQKYEKAKNRISASKLFEFAQLLEKPVAAFFEGIEADRMYYNYDFLSEKFQLRKSEKFSKEILPLIRAFNRIENPQAKKHLTALALAISEPREKKVKHRYS